MKVTLGEEVLYCMYDGVYICIQTNIACPLGDSMRQHLAGFQGPPGPPGASVSVEEVASRVIAYIQRKPRRFHRTPQKYLFKAVMVTIFKKYKG